MYRISLKFQILIYTILFALLFIVLFLTWGPPIMDIQAMSKLRRKSSTAEPVKLENQPSDQQNLDTINRLRRASIRDFCKRNNLVNETVEMKELSHIIVIEKYSVLFCYIAKVGCTQWKSVMANLSDSSPKRWIHSVKKFIVLSTYPTQVANRMLKTYYKFVFVREPFERLLSAYIDKFYNRSPAFLKKYGKSIKRFAQGSDHNYQDITFDEFVNYVLHIGDGYWNEHWQTYNKLCHPCAVDYDFIGRFENLKSEAPYAIHASGIDRNSSVVFPDVKPSSTASKIPLFYSQLQKERLSSLIRLLRADSEMFGYDFPTALAYPRT